MNLHYILLISVITALTSCNGQPNAQAVKSAVETKQLPVGDTVTELSNNIMIIHQDKNHNYWFGSWQDGLFKYDGKTLIQYTTNDGLYTNRIDDIQEDKFGNIYLVGMNDKSTITKFDGKSFAQITAIPSNEWKLEVDDVWLKNPFQANQKVYRFDGKKLYELIIPKPSGLDNPFEIYSIYHDIKGNIWFGTNPVGVCRFDGVSFNWITEEDVTEFRNEGANGVRSITEDKNGDFWFNTENRYSIYDSETLKSKKFYTRHQSIGNLDGKNTSGLNEYLSTVRDNENNLWFVTYRDGVWKYDGEKITQYAVQENSKDITLFSIYKDNNGVLWLGTHENGVYRFNGENFERFTH